MAQEALFRILRPYWYQQRQIQSALLDVVRQAVVSSARAEQFEPHQRQSLEALWKAVHALEVSGDNNQKLQQDQLRSQQQDHVVEKQRIAAVENAVKSLQRSTQTFEQSAGSHLQALTEQLTAVTTSNTALHRRLYAAPYMDNPDRFRCTDARGRAIIGFRSRRGSNGDACLGFEDIFRGPEPVVRERMRAYLPLLEQHERVVEIGCGRGELLDLLGQAGIPAVGVDIDGAMVRRCRAKGLAVEQQDGLAYLREQPDASLPAIIAVQVVEHLSYEELMSFLELSRTKLRPEGQLIFETVNPHSLPAFKTFWTDLTHQRPIFPEVAVALCWLLDFDQASVFFPNGSGDMEQDLTSQGEYAVVATRRSDD
jgi:SAM-dependent methyltransferase